jgi:hypothetical protein
MAPYSNNSYPYSKLRGGHYPSLMCFGNSTMLGSIRADWMTLRGNLEGNYELRVGTLRATGSMQVPKLSGNNVLWYGNSKARCNMEIARALSFNDSFIGEGSIVCPIIKMNGSVTHRGRITAQDLTAKGVLSLAILESNDIRIEFSERSNCASITGKRILITRRPLEGLARFFMPLMDTQDLFFYVSGDITGDSVSLENVVADRVIGNDVIIGPGCRINKVIYRDHIYIDEAACVDWYEPKSDEADGELNNKQADGAANNKPADR